MVGVVVEEDELFYATFHHDVYGFAPVAVSPALFASGIFVGEILCVIDEHVSAFSKLADVLIENGMAGFIVCGVDQDFAFGFHAEAETSLRMVEPFGVDGAMIKLNAAFVDIGKLAACGHLTHVDREIGIGHLLFESLLQSARAAGGVKDE